MLVIYEKAPSISPSTSLTHVLYSDATLTSCILKNATLPLSSAPRAKSASFVRALVRQRHPLLANRPRQHMHHLPRILLVLSNLQRCYFAFVYCEMCIISSPLQSKGIIVSPSTLPAQVPSSNVTLQSCVLQQCYFAVVYCAMCVIYEPCTSPYGSKKSSPEMLPRLCVLCHVRH